MFVEVTKVHDGASCLVNLDHVILIQEADDAMEGTLLFTINNGEYPLRVKEAYSTLWKRIFMHRGFNEYRLD